MLCIKLNHHFSTAGFHAAMASQRPDGEAAGGWFPAEKLSLEATLHAFTAVPAWVSRKEGRLGVLKPGMLADLTVFAEDFSALPPEKLLSAKVEPLASQCLGGALAVQRS
jgi:hypothetical protein